MKALCVKQPWATAIAMGLKTIESRTWRTKYRGTLAIVAPEGADYIRPADDLKVTILEECVGSGQAYEVCRHVYWRRGQIACVAELVDCRRMTREDEHNSLSSWDETFWAWELVVKRVIVPGYHVRGRLGLFDLPDHVVSELGSV